MAAELTTDVGSSGGNREDLADIIGFLKPMDTLLWSTLGHTEAYATYHEWLKDSFQSASQDNAAEGGDFSEDSPNQPTRAGNYTQINKKQVKVSGTQEAVRKAGRDSDYDYHIGKKTQEMMRDIEYTLMKGSSASGSTRGCQGLEVWLTSAVDSATANRTLTLALANGVLKTIFDNGGVPDYAFVPSALAASFAALTSGSGDYRRVAPNVKELAVATTTYVSPFDNSISLKVHRYMTSTSIVFIESDYFKVADLRSPFHERLAKSGDSVRGQVVAEYTLEARQEKAGGILKNVT